MAEQDPKPEDTQGDGPAEQAGSAPSGREVSSEPAPAPAARKGGGAMAGLALLVATASLALSGWLAWKDWQQPALAPTPASAPVNVETTGPDVEAELARLQQQINQQRQAAGELSEAQGRLDAQEQQAQGVLANLSQRLDAMAATDRSDWKLAEVEYLLRLANQRLFTGGDVNGALALLRSADAIVKELGYADLLPLRSQLAREIAALARTPALDTEGVYLQLSALSGEVDGLVFFGPPEALPAETEQAFVLEGEDLEQQLQSGWQQALESFSDLVRVTPRSVDIQPLLTAEQRLFLRARIRLLLEQAKNAVLLRQPRVFEESLRQAQELISSYFEAEDPATIAALASCEQLREQQLEAELPDISRSQAMMREYLQGRTGTRG